MRVFIPIAVVCFSHVSVVAAQTDVVDAFVEEKAELNEKMITLSLRGGTFDRLGGSYMQHAEVFGFEDLGAAEGGGAELLLAVTPWLRVGAAYSLFESKANDGEMQLTVTSQSALGVVEADVFRYVLRRRPVQFRLSVSAGAGGYRLSEDFDGEKRSDWGLGGQGRGTASLDWRSFTVFFDQAYHHSFAELHDNLGGAIRAQGHQTSIGAGLRF